MGQEGKVLHGYAYDARNRLERAWNEEGEEAAYLYNGMGQRVEKRSSTEPEEYLLDLTKPYHNLLGIQREKETESCQTADYLGRFPQIISDGNTCHSLRSMR